MTDTTTDKVPWYLNQTGVLSAGQSAFHPEGGRVMSDEDIPPGTRDLPGKLEKEDVQMEQEHQAHLDRRAAGESELRQTESQRPAIPRQQQIGPPPDAKEYHKYSGAWLGAMAMIGALAAKSGRVSGTAALSAFSGAMKGWQEGNLQAYTEAAEKWQNENKRTIENNRQLLEKYDMVLNDHRMNIDQQLAALQRNAVEDHDDIGYRLAREGNMTAIGQRYDMLWEYTNGEKGIALRAAKLQEPLDKQTAELKQMALYWGPRMEQLEGGPYSTAFKQNVKYAVQNFGPGTVGFGEGGRGAGVSGVRMSPRNEFIQNYMSAHGGQRPSEDEITNFESGRAGQISAARVTASAEPQAMAKTLKDFATGKQGQLVNSLNVAIDHLEVLRELGRALNNGNNTLFNKMAKDWAAATGNPVPTNFEMAKDIIGKEINKGLIAGGGGVTERQQFSELLDRKWAPEQIEGQADTAQRLLAGQFRGLKRQYEANTHRTDFDAKMSDKALEIYNRLGPTGGGGGGKTVIRTGTVNSGPNKGKTVVEYSDGTREYQ